MVATIAAGTTANYYSKQSEYYLGGGKPRGHWITSTSDFGVRHGEQVDNAHFERLHGGSLSSQFAMIHMRANGK